MDEWLIVYRGFTDDELTEEFDLLRALSQNPFQSQTEGSRAYTRSTAETRDRLAALTRVRSERSGTQVSWKGIADFSGTVTDDRSET